MAHPEISPRYKEIYEFYEASSNVFGILTRMTLFKVSSLRYLTADGDLEIQNFEIAWSIVMLHQINHFNGTLFFHNLSKLIRNTSLCRARKMK
tara:strand:- start:139 stop:417 length:279 start_codon:yes stop_codon:yes gene_type:complete